MKRSFCYMLIVLGMALAVTSYGSGNTQTNEAYYIYCGDNINFSVNALEVNVEPVSFTIVSVNDAAIIENYLPFEADNYCVIGQKPYDLYLYAGYFDPNGQFT